MKKINEVIVERRIYPAYTDMKNAIIKYPVVTQRFGEYQFIFSSKKGKISLITLKGHNFMNKDIFEIFCLDGDLFKHEKRFDTEREAEEYIRDLLE